MDSVQTQPAEMDPILRSAAEAARGFMPPDEGLALYQAGLSAALTLPGSPLLEVGSYCGKSSVYLGAAAQAADSVLIAVDHHRGSEENQPGWEWHEPDLMDDELGVMDTLGWFRRTIYLAGLEGSVIAVAGDSPTVSRVWSTPCAFVGFQALDTPCCARWHARDSRCVSEPSRWRPPSL